MRRQGTAQKTTHDTASSSKGSGKRRHRKLPYALLVVFLSIGFVAALLFSFQVVLPAENASATPTMPEISPPSWAMEKDSLSRVYRESLDEAGKADYDALESAMRQMRPLVILSSMEKPEFGDLFDMVAMDNPDIFWVDCHWGFLQHPDGKHALAVLLFLDYGFDEAKALHEKYMRETEKIADSCLAEARGSYIQLPETVFDEVINRLSYGGNKHDQNIPALFGDMGGECVCAGYAKSYKLLCDAAGLECACVKGNTSYDEMFADEMNQDSENSGTHMWNIVSSSMGLTYDADTTWQDCDGKSSRFFNYWKDDYDFTQNHWCPPYVENLRMVRDEESFAEQLESEGFIFVRNIDDDMIFPSGYGDSEIVLLENPEGNILYED